MTGKLLESGAISAFCSSVATMLAAGVQTDEATHYILRRTAKARIQARNATRSPKVAEGSNLADAMEADRRLPRHATETVRVGEASGRTERSCAAGATTIAKAARSPSCATRWAIRRRCCAS